MTRGLRPDNAYLYFRGHNIFDQVTMPLLQTVRRRLEDRHTRDYSNREKEGFYTARRTSEIRRLLTAVPAFDAYPEIRRIGDDIEILERW
jgi:hypothetical protein